MAHIWRASPSLGTERHDKFLALLDEFREMDSGAYQQAAPTIAVVRAGVRMVWLKDDVYSRTIALEVLKTDCKDDQARITAHWVLFLAFKAIEDIYQAKQHLHKMIESGHTMHQLRALAQRELAKLPNEQY